MPAGFRPTLAGMLRDHFIEEVRRRDRDGDGSLSRREWGGSTEEFQQLDNDGDGLIRARDLIRAALIRNPQLTEMVAGRWAPVYDRLLEVADGADEEQLHEAIQKGIAEIHERPVNQEVTGNETAPQVGSVNDTDSTPTELFVEFIAEHDDLRALHQRIQDLADRLGRHRRYVPIDLLA
ncbi:MAG: hypothetical protein Kow0074_21620 [Candidatus Zixiibacteriota bacterium]